MQLSFHGAAGGVTGSCHLLEAAGRRILIDCGMFQGSRALDEENAAAFGFDPASIDAVLLTHAHLDHCGRLPLLCKRGFKGPIVATAPTRELAEIVMRDAAALHREERRRPDRHRSDHRSNGHAAAEPEPLFDDGDVNSALGLFAPAATYGAARDLFPGVRATFHNAGHILGSAWVLVEASEPGGGRRLVFSGDLGDSCPPLIQPPEPAPPCDVLVLESTYGDRNHRSLPESVAELIAAIAGALRRGGNVVIPTFAIERAQALLFFLHQALHRGELPRDLPVYLDSPMAISATGIFQRHADDFNSETRALLLNHDDPFTVPNLHLTRDAQASRAVNEIAAGAVIMAGSGMAAGGRVVYHLQRSLPRPECSVILVGYAGVGTLGRRLAEHATEVRIFGNAVPVRAQVSTIGGFSAHAGHDDLLKWVDGARPGRVFLVHGEPAAGARLAADLRLAGVANVTQPELSQVVTL